MKLATMYLLAVLLGATSIAKAQSQNEALVKEGICVVSSVTCAVPACWPIT